MFPTYQLMVYNNNNKAVSPNYLRLAYQLVVYLGKMLVAYRYQDHWLWSKWDDRTIIVLLHTSYEKDLSEAERFWR